LKISINSKCICGSDKKYKKCCKELHDGKPAKTALELMRSRYSAFALCKIDYIIDTTHFNNPEFTQNRKRWQNDM